MSTAKSLSVRETASRLGHTQKYVRDLLYEGRLKGAKKVGRQWAIPAATVEGRIRDRQKAQGEPERAA